MPDVWDGERFRVKRNTLGRDYPYKALQGSGLWKV